MKTKGQKYIINSNKLYCGRCGKLLKDIKFQLQTEPKQHIYKCEHCHAGYKVSEEDHKKNKGIVK